MKKNCCFLLIGILLVSTINSAQATVSCHCFKERTYNPENKFSTDEYLLVTTFNSFLSKIFGVPKRDIVMMKMKGGAKPDDVIIGLYVSKHTGADIEELMSQKKNGHSWQEILKKGDLKKTEDESPLLSLQSGEEDMKVASSITENLLHSSFQFLQEDIDHLRQKRLSYREITFFFLLASHVGTTGEYLVDQQRQNRMSLSEMAYNFGFTPGDIKIILEKSPSANES